MQRKKSMGIQLSKTKQKKALIWDLDGGGGVKSVVGETKCFNIDFCQNWENYSEFLQRTEQNRGLTSPKNFQMWTFIDGCL